MYSGVSRAADCQSGTETSRLPSTSEVSACVWVFSCAKITLCKLCSKKLTIPRNSDLYRLRRTLQLLIFCRSCSVGMATSLKIARSIALLVYYADRASHWLVSILGWRESFNLSNRTLSGRSVGQTPLFSLGKGSSQCTTSRIPIPTSSPVKRPTTSPVPSPTKRLRLSGPSSAGSEPVMVHL